MQCGAVHASHISCLTASASFLEWSMMKTRPWEELQCFVLRGHRMWCQHDLSQSHDRHAGGCITGPPRQILYLSVEHGSLYFLFRMRCMRSSAQTPGRFSQKPCLLPLFLVYKHPLLTPCSFWESVFGNHVHMCVNAGSPSAYRTAAASRHAS